MDDVRLYGTERFVSDHDEDLLLLLQVDEVSEPRLLRQSGGDRLRLEQTGAAFLHIYLPPASKEQKSSLSSGLFHKYSVESDGGGSRGSTSTLCVRLKR